MSEVYRHRAGDTPLIVSLPHCGTLIPDPLAARMTPSALMRADTDWHTDRLYDFAGELGAHMLMANLSRYVVDLNRDPTGQPLYPGQENTGLCPLDSFDRLPLYRAGEEPDAAEMARRTELYWRPYHDRLRETLARVKEKHGVALLFDAHSIRSRIPRFFAGRLPDLNLGTGGGGSADRALAERLFGICREAPSYSAVLDGRFQGGFITRHYGAPASGIHAIQLELVQATYMDETPPFLFRAELAERLRPTLRRLLAAMLDWAAARQATAG
jgi:N-formylglutamate deformylase